MGIISELFIVFNIIFLCCTVFATETSKCDCDIFQIYYSEDESYHRNFTKQTAEIKGRPIYHSYKEIIWWNDDKNIWMGHKG